MTPGTFKIRRRFRGPTHSGNGGYTCGLFASLLEVSPVRVTLLAPPPLDETLTIEETERGLVAKAPNGTPVAAAKPGRVDVTPPVLPSLEEARATRERFLFHDYHTFPECFTCGTGRERGDGLRIFAAPLPNSSAVAAVWCPSETLPATDGVLAPEIVWAALDCPGAFACMRGEAKAVVLGRMCAEIHQPVRVGEEYSVLGWPIATEGRKEEVATAVISRDREILAVAHAVWVTIDDDHASFSVSPRR